MNRLALFAVILVFGSAALAAAERSSFEALPEQTVLAIHMPQPGQIMDKLTKTTKFGQVMFGENRMARLFEAVKEHDDQEWNEFIEHLSRVGLKPEDLPKYMKGDCGYGLVMHDRKDKLAPSQDEPMMVGLAWLTPGEELAGKFVEAIAKGVEIGNEESEDPVKIKRVDVELAGHKVIQFAQPVFTFSTDDVPWEGEAGETEIREENVRREQTNQVNIFVTQVGGRVLIAHTIEQSKDVFHELSGGDKKVDFDRLSGVEQAAGVFARFLAAHEDADASYSAHITRTPGLADAMPAGDSIIEIYGDMRPFWKLAKQAVAEDADEKEMMDFLEKLGVMDMNVGAMKLSLQGNSMRMGMFLSAPAPRKGVAKLFEQPVLQPKPQAWAPAHVTEYSHLSFDLGAAYDLVRQIVIEKFGDDAKMYFDQADMTLQNMTQSDLKSVLSGLGKVHTAVRFISKFDPDADVQKPGDQTRMALIWKLSNEPAWTRLIQALAPFTMQMGEQMKAADEQGFTGWRLNMPQMEGSLMIGKGHMALSVGNEVTEQVLTVLRNPPDAADTLASADWVKRAHQAFEFKPGFAYSVTDSGRMIDSMIPSFKSAMKQFMTMQGGDTTELWEKLEQVMPDAEAFKGTFDVSGSHALTTQDGVVFQGFTLMPAP